MTEPTPATQTNQTTDDELAGRTFTLIVRVVLGLALLGFCAVILSPFLHAVLWGVLLAVALVQPFNAVSRTLGGRPKTTAALFALVALAGIVVPTILLSASLFEGAEELAARFSAEKAEIPPPAASVADWPLIGGAVHDLWARAANDASALIEPLVPHLQAAAGWLASLVGSLGGALLQMLFAILIAAPLLARAAQGERITNRFASRLVGARGTDFAKIATVTIRGVARGILGVAIIQSMLAGIGFVAVGIPAAGAWTALCLVLCVVQVPAGVVIVPTIIYAFTVEPTTTAVIYAVWGMLVTLSDNVLRPFLFGSAVETPALVLLIGSIGGLLTSGVIGLFTGAVVLALGYELVTAWLADPPKGAGGAEVPAAAS